MALVRALAGALLACCASALHIPGIYDTVTRWGWGMPCPYADDPPTAVYNMLQSSIFAQDMAVNNVTDAVSGWWDQVRSGRPQPLVLLLTGSEGVGKTEMAQAIASAVLTGRKTAVGGKVPQGLVMLHGGDFVDRSNITALQMRVREAIAQSLYECHGHSVLIFDEIQKAAKEALDPLVPLLQGRHARLAYTEPGGGSPTILDASRMIIVLISDIGVVDIEAFVSAQAQSVVQAAGSTGGSARRNMQAIHKVFATLMRQRVTDEFRAGGIDLGGLINAIIPLMPFNQSGVRTILNRIGLPDTFAALAPVADDASAAGSGYVDRMEWSEELLTLLSLPRYLTYNGYKEANVSCMVATNGRKAANGKPASGAPGAPGATGSNTATATVGADGRVSAQGTSGESQSLPLSVCSSTCEVNHYCMVRYGCRRVLRHFEGPLQTLHRRVTSVLRRQPTKKAELAALQPPKSGAAASSAVAYAETARRAARATILRLQPLKHRSDEEEAALQQAQWSLREQSPPFPLGFVDRALHAHHPPPPQPPHTLPDGSTGTGAYTVFSAVGEGLSRSWTDLPLSDAVREPLVVTVKLDVWCGPLTRASAAAAAAGQEEDKCGLPDVGVRITRCVDVQRRLHAEDGDPTRPISWTRQCKVVYEGPI